MSQAARLVCSCGNILALVRNGLWVSGHRGRQTAARELVFTVCEDCGATTRLAPAPEAASSSPDTPARS